MRKIEERAISEQAHPQHRVVAAAPVPAPRTFGPATSGGGSVSGSTTSKANRHLIAKSEHARIYNLPGPSTITELTNFMTTSRVEMDQMKGALQSLQKMVEKGPKEDNGGRNLVNAQVQWSKTDQKKAKMRSEEVDRLNSLERALDSYDHE